MVKALSFNAVWTGTFLPGNNGNTLITPNNCRTASYTAGAGEVAFISLTGTASAGVNDVLYIFGMNSVNGGAFTLRTQQDSAESLSDGTANASVQGVLSLEAGKTYVFAAAFASNANLTVNPAYCHGAVLILKTAS